jgi:hypothetical protein
VGDYRTYRSSGGLTPRGLAPYDPTCACPAAASRIMVSLLAAFTLMGSHVRWIQPTLRGARASPEPIVTARPADGPARADGAVDIRYSMTSTRQLSSISCVPHGQAALAASVADPLG